MDILNELFGATENDDDQTRVTRARDFVSRVEAGDKLEGYSSEEAFQNYASVTQRLSNEEFESVTADALRQLSPAQRREFAQVMQEQGGVDVTMSTEDPDLLAGIMSQLRIAASGNASGLPGGLLGGGANHDLTGALAGLLGGGNIGPGGVEMANQAGIAGLLNNPIVKMVIGLIAANGMKYVLAGQDERESESREDSGGGFLDSLLGRDDDNTESERDRQEQRPSDNSGGFLDSLFGGGDDRDETRDDTDTAGIDQDQHKRRL